MNLHVSDREDISDGAWLNDRVIDAVNSLVARYLGTMSQSTLLADTERGFGKVAEGPHITILHDADHWVVAASVGDKVYFCDSLNRPTVYRSASLAR